MSKEYPREEEDRELIEECMEMASDDAVADWFDDTFIHSVYESCEFDTDEPKELTEGQRQALKNIHSMLTRKIENSEE